MTFSISYAVPIVLLLAAYDLLYRRCPNWMSLPLLAIGIITGGYPAFYGAFATFLIMTIAQFPFGDVKGAAAMAAWVPFQVMVPGLFVALVVTMALMETRWYSLYQRAHRWPWLAGLAVSLTMSASVWYPFTQ